MSLGIWMDTKRSKIVDDAGWKILCTTFFQNGNPQREVRQWANSANNTWNMRGICVFV
jgi:hypothetical protein